MNFDKWAEQSAYKLRAEHERLKEHAESWSRLAANWQHSAYELRAERNQFKEINDRMAADRERLITERDMYRDLAKELYDDGECWLDHHGGCQEHMWLEPQPGESCPDGRAQRLFEAQQTHTTTQSTDERHMMIDPMTSTDTDPLTEIRARLDAATEGPWTYDVTSEMDEDGATDLGHVLAPGEEVEEGMVAAVALKIIREDAAFIAHAREDVPFLLSLVEQLQTERNAQAELYSTTVDKYEERLHSLEADSAKLNALEAAGVDNWSGYDCAMEILKENNND